MRRCAGLGLVLLSGCIPAAAGVVLSTSDGGSSGGSSVVVPVQETSFVLANPTPPFVSAYAVAAGDVDRDGDIDLLFAHFEEPGGRVFPVRVEVNDGHGQFADSGQRFGPTLTANQSMQDLALADLDGDGDLDAVIAASDGTSLWRNDGAGAFRDTGQRLVLQEATQSHEVRLVDLDRDDDVDLLALYLGRTAVFHNDGAGVFTLVEEHDAIGGLGGPFAAGDLDGDRRADLVASQHRDSDQRLQVLLNDGTGRLIVASAVRVGPPGTRILTATLVDLDGDRDLDVVGAGDIDGNGLVWFCRGSGDGTFDGPTELASEFSRPATRVVAGDVNRDGRPDFVVSLEELRRVYLNVGGAAFGITAELETPILDLSPSPRDLVLADLDGDRDLELVECSTAYEGRVFFNQGPVSPPP